MKAIVRDRYGSPDVLQLREVERPAPGEHDVLIRIHAASVNASDWEVLRGKPLYARLSGPLRPSERVLGSDVAGRVEAVGSGVERFRPGDEVFGDLLWHGSGAFAEYVRVPERALIVPKPAGLTFEQAAALPQAAVIAWQGLSGNVRAGDRVLVNGAGGGAGTFAVMLARSFGAEVTGVDNGRKTEFLRSLGVDRVIDYEREDYTRAGTYDFVLDLAGHRSIFACRRALKPAGRYAVAGGSVAALLQAALLGPVLARRRMGVLMVRPNQADLTRVGALAEDGTLKPVIDGLYPLEQVPAAIRRVGEGRALGKVVIGIAA